MRRAAPADTPVPASHVVDLASLAEVRRLATIIAEVGEPLDVLVNNAAVQPSRRRLSPDGFELGLAVNHLAPFLLTHLLAPLIGESGGRVVTTSSSTHAHGVLDFEDLQLTRAWTSRLSYGTSKLANILFTLELRERTGLPSSTFHPGAIRTDINRESPYVRIVKPLKRFLLAGPEKGADTMVWLATETEGGTPTALYYIDRKPADPTANASDAVAAARLWDVSSDLVGLTSPAR